MTVVPPVPHNEQERLAHLRDLVVLDSEPEPLFDAIALMASQACGVPVALLSLIDAERQWFKANVGLPGVQQTPRDVAFCAHAIGSDLTFEVPDATQDPRFAGNPLVTGAPDIRFYAGAPLKLPGGARVGTLCVIDRQPRQLTDQQHDTLRSLAAIASQALLMRRNLIQKTLAVRSEHEQAMAHSEARYRALVEEQTEMVSLAQSDGTLVYANSAYAGHFGRTPAQLQGSNLFDLVQPQDRDSVRARIHGVLHSGHSESSENRMLAADGSERWVAWSNTRQLDAQGLPLLHSVGRDITQQRQAETALRASQAFLASTGRVAGVGGWQLDLLKGEILWSAQTRAIHEVAADYQPTLDSAIQFYAPEARPLIEGAVQRAMDTGAGWDLELPFTTARGRAIWVRAVGEAEFVDGQPVRLLGAFQDITERKALQQQVADSEHFVRQITDNLPVRIAYVDAGLRYRFVNLAHCHRFGRPREQILGRTRAELVQGSSDAVVAPHLAAVLAGQAQRFEFEEDLSGVRHRIESQLIPDVAADGQVRGFFSTGVDITERSAAERALRELADIFDNTSDFVMQTDWRGQVSYMNPAVRRATGMADDAELAELNFADFNTPATQRRFAEEILPAVKAHGVWLGNTSVYLAGRREVAVSHMIIGHRDATGRIGRYSAVLRDISAEVQAQQQLQRQAATLRTVTEALPVIVSAVDAQLRYRFVNSAFERWYGISRQEIIGRHAHEVLSPADVARSQGWVARALAGETVSFEREYPQRPGAPHLAVTYVPVRLDDGRLDGVIGIAHDITPHRHEQMRLQQLARRDALTGLLNRAGFEEALQAQGSAPRALLYIDLDHFKPVNDQHGHPVGDQVLQQFGQRLQALVRPTDAVARLGGDEFAVLLVGLRDSAPAHAVADKVLAAAGMVFDVGPLRLQIGASVGVAFGTERDTGWQDLVARADGLLYEAKRAGRGRKAGTAD